MSLLQFNVLTGECCACKNEELKSTHLYHTNYFHPLYDQPGLSFPDECTGIRAHVQHLKAYGSSDPLNGDLVDPRYHFNSHSPVGVGTCI